MIRDDFLARWSNLWRTGPFNGGAYSTGGEPCIGLPDGSVIPLRKARA